MVTRIKGDTDPGKWVLNIVTENVIFGNASFGKRTLNAVEVKSSE